MKKIVLLMVTLCSVFSFAQDNDEQIQKAKRIANNFVYEGNEDLKSEDYIEAEMAYRKAISEEQSNISGIYNLGTSYFKKGNYDEALFRLEEAAVKSTDKAEKHKAYHNMGNILMQNKKCKEAVEAYKNALRNDPTDEETRYNFGLAKECEEQQKQDNQNNEDDNQEQNKDQNQDNKDENKDQKDQDNQDQNKEDDGDKKDQDQKDGDQDEKEDGKPKDDKQDQGQGDKDKKEQPQQPKPQQGQMSPQQIKNLLEAMNNQEQKVQEKMNAEKTKGVQIQTDKDW
ncbi:tetratricopeptide repeat protein [Formosa sp. S-31]